MPFNPMWDIPGCVAALEPALLGSMWKENSAGPGLTHPAVDTDPCGQYISPVGGYQISNGADVGRPLLDTQGGRACLKFTPTQLLDFFNAKTDFSFLASTATWALLAWIYPNSNATAMHVFDTNNFSGGTSVGLSVQRTAANKYEVYCTNGSAAIFDVTPTQTHVAADGFQRLAIRCSATGAAGLKVQIGSNTAQTFTVGTLAAAKTPLTFQPRIGARASSNSNPFTGWMGGIYIFNQAVSDSDLALFDAYNPARSSSNGYRNAA